MSIQSFLAVSAAYLFSPPAPPLAEVRAPEFTALLLTRELARVKAWRRITAGDPAPKSREQVQDLAANA